MDGVIPTEMRLHVFDDLNGVWVSATDLLSPFLRRRGALSEDWELRLSKLFDIGLRDRSIMQIVKPMSDVVQGGSHKEKAFRNIQPDIIRQVPWFSTPKDVLACCTIGLDIDGVTVSFREPLNTITQSYNVLLCAA
jgi:hypothetical protein